MRQLFKTGRVLFATFAMAALAGACSSTDEDLTTDENNGGGNDGDTQVEEQDVTFTASVVSRASLSSFDSGDAILVYAVDADGNIDAATPTYTFSDGIFSSTAPFTVTEGEQRSYTAIFPATTDIYTLESFSAQENQSSASSFSQSLLLAGVSDMTDSATPALTFYNMMSAVEVTVEVEGDSSPELTAVLNMATTATFDVTDQTCAAADDATISEITPLQDGSIFTAVIAPQDITAETILGSFTYDGYTYDWSEQLAQSFESGYKYTFTASIDPGARIMTVKFTGAIDEWETDENNGSGGLLGQATLVLSKSSVTLNEWDGASNSLTFETDAEANTISIENDNDWFTAIVEGDVITITSTAANEGESAKSGEFTIEVGDELASNSAKITVSQDGTELYIGKIYREESTGTLGMIYWFDTTTAYAISVKGTQIAWAAADAIDADGSLTDSFTNIANTSYNAIGAAAYSNDEFPTLTYYDGGAGYPAYNWVKTELGANWMLPTRYDMQSNFNDSFNLSNYALEGTEALDEIFLSNGGDSFGLDIDSELGTVRYWTCQTNGGGTKPRYYDYTTGKASENMAANDGRGAVRGVLYISLQ